MCTRLDDQSQHNLPCLHCHPHTYIRMVQHMIERCMLLRMTRDECVKALDQHASILPPVTLTVWRGLQKENKDFFETFGHFFSLDHYQADMFGDHQGLRGGNSEDFALG